MKNHCESKLRATNACAFSALFIAAILTHILAPGAPTASLPTIVTNNLASGTKFATRYYLSDSGKPGPSVMIVGGVHGNEPAGAAAAEVIRHWPIEKGKLLVIARANVLGLEANKRTIPGLDTNLNNLNRNYPRAGIPEGPRGDLAEAIWNVALKFKPDWLLDLHEGYDFNQVNEKSVGSSVIVFPTEKGKTAAKLMLAAVNADITNSELKFVRRDMPVDGSLARAGGEHLRIPSFTLETTSKQPLARRVMQHEVMVHTLFKQLGMLTTELPGGSLAAKITDQRSDSTSPAETPSTIRIGLYQGPGTGGAGPPNLLKKLSHAPDTTISMITPEEISTGVLTNFDVVIFGGGSGSKQAAALGDTGRKEVRQFVEQGGGYIGICAGAYLATSGYTWSLNLINARTISPKWQRGKGDVKVELTDPGRSILGDYKGPISVHYANGPVVKANDKADLPPMNILAWFRTEMAENESPAGIMVDSPAVFSAPYKRGQVVCISPHPEQTPGLEEVVPHAVAWVAPKDIAARKALPRAE